MVKELAWLCQNSSLKVAFKAHKWRYAFWTYMYFKPTQVWYKWYKACAQSRTCACKTSSGLVRRWCYGYRGRSSRMSHSSLFWLHCIIKSSLFCFSFLLKALFLKVAKTAAAYLVTETSLKTEQEIKCVVDRTICVLSKMVKKKTPIVLDILPHINMIKVGVFCLHLLMYDRKSITQQCIPLHPYYVNNPVSGQHHYFYISGAKWCCTFPVTFP